jgi:tRNA-splicing endonuclease subunit Sen54
MADADEDVIPQTSSTDVNDLEDETQDFRFLSQFTSASRTGQSVIPKRGNKDFEPNPTRSQASSLDASRLAMHTALSVERIHTGKNHNVGQYIPDESDWQWDEDQTTSVRHGRCVVARRFGGVHLKSMGVADRNNWTWLLPEEALFLLERGSLDIRWPDIRDDEVDQTAQAANTQPTEQCDAPGGTDPADHDAEVGELPMSLQGAYASFIGKDGLTLERYTVYAGLKRTGYVVQRAPTWHHTNLIPARGNGSPSALSDSLSRNPQQMSNSVTHPVRSPFSKVASFIHRLVAYLFRPQVGESCPSLGPLVAPGLYRNYADMFRALSLIPYHATCILRPETPPPLEAPYRIHFHAWKPSTASTWKKTSPPPPDYRICVIDARETSSIPSLSQIGPLLDSQQDDSLSKEQAGRLETRLKHGKRNVLVAVVDAGIVSYLRLSDACFGAEKLYEEKVRRGTKGQRRPQTGTGQGHGHGQTPRRNPPGRN